MLLDYIPKNPSYAKISEVKNAFNTPNLQNTITSIKRKTHYLPYPTPPKKIKIKKKDACNTVY